MLESKVGCLLMCFTTCISVVAGKPNSFCALKGSSAALTCSAPHSHTDKKWFIDSGFGYHELPADRNGGKYRISEDSFYTLTINNLTKTDGKFYCCCENNVEPSVCCQQNRVLLSVTDVQVKVFPASEGQKVTLMCTTSCSLTETPAAFIWYQNTEFIYEDWSPWYQELVSSEDSVRYSCAVKGYEQLRAPDVSVGFVTSSCFNVIYSEGRICSKYRTSEKQSCSIVLPRELHVERKKSNENHFSLTCDTVCSLSDPLLSFELYMKRQNKTIKTEPNMPVPSSMTGTFFCDVRGYKDLHSDEVCVNNTNCWSLNYISRRICALRGSSVNISSKYSHPERQQLKDKRWYKVKINAEQEDEQLTEIKDKVKFQDMKNQHILTLTNLQMKDSAEYRFEVKTDDDQLIQPGVPGVNLIVTDVRVDVGPAAEVTEGQRVTLSCRTSCPLTENTNYIWFFNSQPLNLTRRQNKQLILDAVSSQDAGNYSCAVRTDRLISSAVTTLTVQSLAGEWKPAAAAVSAALLLFIPLIVFLFRKKKFCQSSGIESADNLEQVNSGPSNDEISAQTAEQEPHYSQLWTFQKNPRVPLHQHREQEETCYAAVKFRTKTTPE